MTWQQGWSGVVTDGQRPLPTFTPVIQQWSDWCFFERAPQQPDTLAAQHRCAVELSYMGLAIARLGADEVCVVDQYRQRIETYFRGGWYRCPSAIDDDPLDDVPSPYFDADEYEWWYGSSELQQAVRERPDWIDCAKANVAARLYLAEQGLYNTEWRCP